MFRNIQKTDFLVLIALILGFISITTSPSVFAEDSQWQTMAPYPADSFVDSMGFAFHLNYSGTAYWDKWDCKCQFIR